jgi:RuvB C-terminal winged helix domain/RuvB AAA lid domain
VLRRCRDVAQVKGIGKIDAKIVDKTLSMLGIDAAGLDEMDRTILKTIIDKFDGGPVGLSTLGASIGEEMETLEEVYEPFLIQSGFLKRTPRGRQATAGAYRHLFAEPNLCFPGRVVHFYDGHVHAFSQCSLARGKAIIPGSPIRFPCTGYRYWIERNRFAGQILQ